MNCPCCGQHIDELPMNALAELPLPIVPRTIANALLKVYPRTISSDKLLSEVYTIHNEPEYARTALSVQLGKLRTHIEPYGWTVTNRKTGRGNKAQYKLEKLV